MSKTQKAKKMSNSDEVAKLIYDEISSDTEVKKLGGSFWKSFTKLMKSPAAKVMVPLALSVVGQPELGAVAAAAQASGKCCGSGLGLENKSDDLDKAIGGSVKPKVKKARKKRGPSKWNIFMKTYNASNPQRTYIENIKFVRENKLYKK